MRLAWSGSAWAEAATSEVLMAHLRGCLCKGGSPGDAGVDLGREEEHSPSVGEVAAGFVEGDGRADGNYHYEAGHAGAQPD